MKAIQLSEKLKTHVRYCDRCIVERNGDVHLCSDANKLEQKENKNIWLPWNKDKK